MNGRFLLLVDDDKVSLLITRKLIQTYAPPNEFAEILIRDQPSEGLTLVAEYLSKNQEFIILLDINMPLISGWDFLDRLQDLDPTERCKVILLTSSVSELDKTRATSYSRVRDFFSKPMDEALVKRLLKHVDQV
jgi:two-component system, CitB family, response regulator MalR